MQRLALLAGVDTYPHVKQLKSCVNDARQMAHTLIRCCGFRAEDCSLLLDAEATRDGILAGLATLQTRARRGDAVVFYFSGHGSQIRIGRASEPDGWSESLVPYDSGRHPLPQRDIGDLEIYDWLLAVSEVTRNLVVIADSCFAAGATRTGWQELFAPGKWIEPDSRPCLAPQGAGAFGALAFRGAGSVALRASRSGFLSFVGDERYVLLAACSAWETAQELPATPPCSAFTRYLCQEIEKAPPDATYRELVQDVDLAMAASMERRQTPQVEGARDRILFTEITDRPAPFLPVVGREGASIDLGGGAAQGVQCGSLWAIHSAHTRRPRKGSEPLGVVRIEGVRSLQASGVLIEERGDIVLGARAFEHALGVRLPVAVEAGPARASEVAALGEALGASPLLDVNPVAGGAGILIVAVDPHGALSGGLGAAASPEARPGIRVDAPSWIVLDAADELQLPPVGRAGCDVGTVLRRGIEDLAIASSLRAIEPDDPEFLAAVDPCIELLVQQPDGRFRPGTPDSSGLVVYRDGDRLALRITQRSGRLLYVYVLSIGPLGAVNVLHPVPGDTKALLSEHAFEVGTLPGDVFSVVIPDGLAAIVRADGRRRCEGREILKIFFTLRRTDMAGWQSENQYGSRTASRNCASPLEERLERARTGTRGGTWHHRDGGPLRDDTAAPAADDRWTAVTVEFFVRGDCGAGDRD